MSRQPRKPRDPELFDIEAGRRMAELFDRARVELGLSTDADLWRKLGVSRDTAQSWMRGERPPSRAVGSKVAAGLGIRYDDLLAVYEGREQSDVDPATVIAALEWAIKMVRSGQMTDLTQLDETQTALAREALGIARERGLSRESSAPTSRPRHVAGR